MRISTAAIFTACAVIGLESGAATYTAGGSTSNSDTWNTATNWTPNAIPSGTVDVVLDGNATAGDATPAYTGDLTINAGKELRIIRSSSSNGLNSLGTGSVTLNTGSKLTYRFNINSTTSNPFVINGDAILAIGSSTVAHFEQRTLDGGISGSGTLGVESTNGNVLFLDSTNSWTGGLVAGDSVGFGDNLSKNGRAAVVGKKALAFGTGDVTIGGGVNLEIEADGAIDSSATLSISGAKATFRNQKLLLNGDITVAEFIVNGVSQGPGVYTSASGLLDAGGANLIGGSGSVTVPAIPEPSSLALLGLGGLLVARRRRG